MTADLDARLQRLLGGVGLAALRQRLRQRYERALLGDVLTGFRLGQLNELEQSALAALLGRPVRGAASVQVDVLAVDTALRRAGIADTLRAALEQLDGPITNILSERHDVNRQWQQTRADCDHPELQALLTLPAGLGLLKRLCRQRADVAGSLLAQAQAVLRRLPAQGLTRAQLAADVLGDAHALDPGCSVAALVLAALRNRGVEADLGSAPIDAFDDTPADDDAREAGPATTRELWAGVGVLVNELARPALCLNLLLKKTGSTESAELRAGEPAYLSLRALLRSPPRLDVSGRCVFVCENPNLLAMAADRLGTRCAPMVCTDGMPAAAQRTLLNLLQRAGAVLRYHGDFDWPGVRIGNHMLQAHGALPWRFSTRDYDAALATAPRPGRHLRGAQTEALWDQALASAMRTSGLAIDEEAVAACLLEDLQAGEVTGSSLHGLPAT